MTVQELIDKLAALPPDLEVWESAPYQAGVRLAHPNPLVETVCFHKSNGNPMLERDRKYQKKPENWTPAHQVVYL